MDHKCVVPVERLRDYVFKPGATHGKDRVFTSLGYSAEDSETLAGLYEQQTVAKYGSGDYIIGRLAEYGQRIT